MVESLKTDFYTISQKSFHLECNPNPARRNSSVHAGVRIAALQGLIIDQIASVEGRVLFDQSTQKLGLPLVLGCFCIEDVMLTAPICDPRSSSLSSKQARREQQHNSTNEGPSRPRILCVIGEYGRDLRVGAQQLLLHLAFFRLFRASLDLRGTTCRSCVRDNSLLMCGTRRGEQAVKTATAPASATVAVTMPMQLLPLVPLPLLLILLITYTALPLPPLPVPQPLPLPVLLPVLLPPPLLLLLLVLVLVLALVLHLLQPPCC